jgi:hypothetical protein
MKQKARLDNWKLIKLSGKRLLCGNVIAHPRHPDGTFVYTSELLELDEESGICETMNTIYRLETRAKSDES